MAKLDIWEDSANIDIAATLREVAANSDAMTGKFLKKCGKAAAKGLSHINIRVSEEDHDYVDRKKRGWTVLGDGPPYVERLTSMGFKLSAHSEVGFFVSRKYYLTIGW